MKVIDLDILRPEPRFVKLGGKEIDVSFVPCAITFDLDDIVQQLVKLDAKTIENDKQEQRRAFGLGVQLCAVFCKHSHPEMDEEWIMNNATPQQVNAFANLVRETLFATYEQIGEHAKN